MIDVEKMQEPREISPAGSNYRPETLSESRTSCKSSFILQQFINNLEGDSLPGVFVGRNAFYIFAFEPVLHFRIPGDSAIFDTGPHLSSSAFGARVECSVIRRQRDDMITVESP